MLRRPLVITLGSRRPLLGMRTYRGHNRIEDMLTASEACRSHCLVACDVETN